MKTEPWDLSYRLQIPPRCDHPNGHSARRIVQLDQWCWNMLVSDRAGELVDGPTQGAYEQLRRLAHAGDVVFPLAQTHYLELWERKNLDARWDTAVVMAELSGFNTISAHGLADWEAQIAVDAHLGLGMTIPTPTHLGWGWSHCLVGRTTPFQVIDSGTGVQPSLDGLPPDQAKSIKAIFDETSVRAELAMLAMHDPLLACHGDPQLAPYVTDAGTRFKTQQDDLGSLIEKYRPSAVELRRWLYYLAFNEMQDVIDRAAVSLGINPLNVLDKLERAVTGGDKEAVTRFMEPMPIQRAFTELRVQAHLKGNFGFAPSDLADFWAASIALATATDLVVDRRTFNLISDSGMDQLSEAKVYRRIDDLISGLALL